MVEGGVSGVFRADFWKRVYGVSSSWASEGFYSVWVSSVGGSEVKQEDFGKFEKLLG